MRERERSPSILSLLYLCSFLTRITSLMGLVSLLLALYTVTIRMGEKVTFFSLPLSGFADVVEVVVLWFSSGLYSSLWG